MPPKASQGEFWLDLKNDPGLFSVEWLNTTAGVNVPARSVEGGVRRLFTTPFPGPAALYLRKDGTR